MPIFSPPAYRQHSKSEPFLADLVEICLSHRPSAIHILRVLVQFADYENHFKIIENIKSKFNQPDVNLNDVLTLMGSAVGAVAYEYLASIKALHRVMLRNLDGFKRLLVETVPDYTVLTTTGTISKPLGFVRLEIVHLFYALLQANNPEMDEAFAEHHILEVLVDLFFEYEYNSFLHNHVNNIVTVIFLNANDSRFKLFSNETERSEFLAIDTLTKWLEKGLSYRTVFNIVWSDRECLQNAKRLMEEIDESSAVSDELKERIAAEITQIVHESLLNYQTSPVKTNYTSLISQVFLDCNLLERLMERFQSILSEKNASPITKPVPTHKGNLIDIAKIVNRFLAEFEGDTLPAELLESASFAGVREAWQTFSANELVLVDNKIIETEQSIKNQQTAEQDFRRYLMQAKIKPLDLDMPFAPKDYEFSVSPFETHLDNDLRQQNLWREQVSLIMPSLRSFDGLEAKFAENVFLKKIAIKDQQFDEKPFDGVDLAETLQSKLDSTKETEEGEQISSLNEKDHLFEPLASSSNISNELNIEMDCEYSFWCV